MQGIPESARMGVEQWPANPFPDGHTVTLTHGAHSERLVGPLSEELLESIDTLVEGTPAAIPTFAAARGTQARTPQARCSVARGSRLDRRRRQRESRRRTRDPSPALSREVPRHARPHPGLSSEARC